MELKISHSFVTVDDHEKALGFYRDVLGLQVTADAPLGPFRWLTVSPPSQPGVEIVLATPDMGHGPDDTEALRTLLAKGALNGVNFRQADLETVWRAAVSVSVNYRPLVGRLRTVEHPKREAYHDRLSDHLGVTTLPSLIFIY